MIGCPLENKFPLGDSRSAPMDERYVGKWVPTESSEIVYIWILPFNENEYYMELNGFKKEFVMYRSFLSVMDNVHIFNVQPISDKKDIVYMPDRLYFFLKLALSDNNNVLTIWNIENKGFNDKNNSKEELFKYVQKNILNDNVYDIVGVFKRDVQN